MKLLVLDGNSIVNRAFYGIRILSTKDGTFTNAIYGFLTILERIKNELSPDAVAIAFDLKAPTFRHKAYSGYKGNRKGMPEELAMQMPILKELLGYLGYNIISCEGFEADDIIGTFARTCEETGDICFIATGDRDSLQLVSKNTSVRLATTRMGASDVTIYDEEKIMEVYGVKPKQLIDIKAIQGDTSDSIPGAKGIGEKGAGELIRKFGSVKYIYENIEEIDIKPAMKAKLLASKEMVELSYYLGEIDTHAPVDTDIQNYKIAPISMKEASTLMSSLELFKLMKKMNISASNVVSTEKEPLEEKTMELKEVAECFSLIPMLEDAKKAYFVPEYENGEINKIYFAIDEIVYAVKPTDIFLKSFAQNKSIKKYTHDVKLFHKALGKMSIKLQNVEMDTILSAYLLNPSASGYDVVRLAQEYGVFIPTDDNVNAVSAFVMPELCKKLEKEIAKNNQGELLKTIEIPLAEVLADMENQGVMVDKQGIVDFGNNLKLKIDELQKSVIEQVGYEFNLNSPKQLGEALFVKMGLPHGKKTKSGFSTNAEVLEGLRFEHPVVEDILTYRTLAKLNSTYCEGLIKVIGEDGRIHSSFNQTETRTGRISSTEPNLQNIPVRTELGKELRKFFVAREGWTLVDADYSQIELRVLSHVANDKVMIDSFNEGKDIHRSTASKVFGIPEDMVTSYMRSSAKAVNFGIVYGIGAFSLSKDIGVTRKEAENYIDEYLRNFSGVKEYMDKVISEAKANGYAEDIFGRRRYLPELSSSNFNMRAFGERVARNMPIQGAAADIIKIAMIKVKNRLEQEKLQGKLILQVHDELIVECPVEESETVKALVEEEMAKAVNMSVPMKADGNIGENWYIAKG